MKTKPFYYLLICCISLSIISCNTESKTVKTESKDDTCYPNSTKPKQVITYEEMADMMNAYDKGAKKELDKYIKKASSGKDTISTNYNWYKLDDLKQYIAYIERISKEKDIEVTGFRIYPSQYSKNYKEKDLRNRSTIIFTPTTTIDGKEDAAFEPLYSTKGKPVGIAQYLEQVRAKKINQASMLNLNLQDGLESSSANRITPTPPY